MGMIIDKALEMKSSSILLFMALLSVHLSVYTEAHEFILKREFIAFLMSLIASEGPKNDFLSDWKQGLT